MLSETERCRRLQEAVGKPELLDITQDEQLHTLLEDFHTAFSLDVDEWGETNLVEMEIHNGDALLKHIQARHMPLAVRQEVSKQLCVMQEAGVIQPSHSPWASPIVMGLLC